MNSSSDKPEVSVAVDSRKTKTDQASAEGRKRRSGRASGTAGFVVFCVLAAACAAYGSCVFAILGPGMWFNYIWFIAAGALVLLGAFFFLLRTHWLIKAAAALIIVLCLVNFGIFEFRAIRCSRQVPQADARWVIVLGAKVNGSTPSVEFRERIEAAADHIRKADAARSTSSDAYPGPLATVIATGGKGSDEGEAEGEVCARELAALGIDPARILIENRSTTTQENLLFAKELIEAGGGSTADGVVIVSSGFHLYRASELAHACGYSSVSGLGSKGLPILVPHYFVREYAAYVKESAMGHFR